VEDERKQLWLRQLAQEPRYRGLISQNIIPRVPEQPKYSGRTATQPKSADTVVIEPLSTWFASIGSAAQFLQDKCFGSSKYRDISRRNKQRRDRAEATRAMLAQGLEELDLTEEEIKVATRDRLNGAAMNPTKKERYGTDIEIRYMRAALSEHRALLLEQVIMEIGVTIPYDANYRQMVYRKLLDKYKAETLKPKDCTEFQHNANLRKMARQGLAHSLRAYRSALLEYDGIMASDAAQRAYEIHHAHQSGRTAGGATVASWWNASKEGALGLGSIFRASRRLPPPC
jgi:hypothetical protein